MVARDLFDLAAANLVGAGIAHVAQDSVAVFDQRQRQDAGHALPGRVVAGCFVDCIVSQGDGLADTLFGRLGRPLQAPPERT
jgi:hypothetical protein